MRQERVHKAMAKRRREIMVSKVVVTILAMVAMTAAMTIEASPMVGSVVFLASTGLASLIGYINIPRPWVHRGYRHDR